MKLTIDVVSLGRPSFKDFRPQLINCLKEIRNLGDVLWIENCRESIILLKVELIASRELQCTNLETEVEQALSLARISQIHHQETLRKNLYEIELQITALQNWHDELRAELSTSTINPAKVAEQVRATHEKKHSAFKSKLMSFRQMSPEA